VGRRNLSSAAALAAFALAVAVPAATAAIRWRVLADGAAPGPGVSSPTASLALDRSGAMALAAKLPGTAARIVRTVDFSRSAVVAIFGEFGCRDHRIAVSALVQQGRTLDVRLVERPLGPGTAECMAIFPTYRVLSLDRSALRSPLPTRATVTVARA
jgi:hypothetical protein